MNVTFTKLGQLGRLGNQLFQIASTIGIANKNNADFHFNGWNYSQYFKNRLPEHACHDKLNTVKEASFHFNEYTLHKIGSYDLHGYFQSEQYFKDSELLVRKCFQFNDDLIDKCKETLPANGKQNIAIHIRRGDYVGNPSHYNLSVRYYLNAIESFENWQDYNLVFFSDDIEFCKWHFSCLPNAYVVNGSEIEDLCSMSLCDHFIIANSSFSWWAAWLSVSESKIIVRPKEHFSGNLSKHDIKNLYPAEWKVVSDSSKLSLLDVTFIIPISYDHNDRIANLNLSVQHLQSNFHTNIHVVEQGGSKFEYTKDFAQYSKFSGTNFHRTKMINACAKKADTSFVVNFDADTIINPVQSWYSVQLLRSRFEIVYPYDGNFKHVERVYHGNLSQNIYWLIDKSISGPVHSFGGAVFMNKEAFLNAGGENENFISWGPEDAERYHRFIILGLNVIRVNGPIYHLDHFRGPNSNKTNRYIAINRKEWHKVESMNKDQLKKYIETWPW